MVTGKVKSVIESEIVKLNDQRDNIDGELKVLVKMLGVADPPKKRKAWKPEGKKPTGQIALKLLEKHDEITPALLAKKAKVSIAAATQALLKLTDDKAIKRTRRGVYAK